MSPNHWGHLLISQINDFFSFWHKQSECWLNWPCCGQLVHQWKFWYEKAIQQVPGQGYSQSGTWTNGGCIWSNKPPGATRWGVGRLLSILPCWVSVKIKCYFEMENQALVVKWTTDHGQYQTNSEIEWMTYLEKCLHHMVHPPNFLFLWFQCRFFKQQKQFLVTVIS